MDVIPTQLAAAMAPLGAGPAIKLLFNAAIDLISEASTTLHPHLSLHPNAGADHVVFDRTQRRLGKIRIPNQLTGTVAEHANAAPNLAVSRSGLTDPVRCQPVVLRSGIRTLEIRILLLRFVQLLTQRVGTTDPKDCHQVNLTLARPGLPRP